MTGQTFAYALIGIYAVMTFVFLVCEDESG